MNAPFVPFDPQIASALSRTLLHFLWQGLLIALLVQAVRLLPFLQKPHRRYFVCLVGLFLITASPLITFFLVETESPTPSPAPASETTIHALALPHDSQLSSTPLPPAQPSSQAEDPKPAWTLHRLVVYVWLIGVILFSLRFLTGFLALLWMRRGSRPLPDAIQQTVARLSRRLRLSTAPRVAASLKVTQAVAFGFFRPVILLPASWLTELPPDVLEAVIAHELAHIRRWDLWVNLLQRIVETLLFYHPAVWWLSGRLRAERELCCDELAVSATGQRLLYARALEFAAQKQLAARRPILAMEFGGKKMTLLNRVRNVLGTASPSRGRWWPAGLLALALPLLAWAYTTTLVPANADDEDPEKRRSNTASSRRDSEPERRDREHRRDREDRERGRLRDREHRERDEFKERDREHREGDEHRERRRNNPFQANNSKLSPPILSGGVAPVHQKDREESFITLYETKRFARITVLRDHLKGKSTETASLLVKPEKLAETIRRLQKEDKRIKKVEVLTHKQPVRIPKQWLSGNKGELNIRIQKDGGTFSLQLPQKTHHREHHRDDVHREEARPRDPERPRKRHDEESPFGGGESDFGKNFGRMGPGNKRRPHGEAGMQDGGEGDFGRNLGRMGSGNKRKPHGEAGMGMPGGGYGAMGMGAEMMGAAPRGEAEQDLRREVRSLRRALEQLHREVRQLRREEGEKREREELREREGFFERGEGEHREEPGRPNREPSERPLREKNEHEVGEGDEREHREREEAEAEERRHPEREEAEHREREREREPEEDAREPEERDPERSRDEDKEQARREREEPEERAPRDREEGEERTQSKRNRLEENRQFIVLDSNGLRMKLKKKELLKNLDDLENLEFENLHFDLPSPSEIDWDSVENLENLEQLQFEFSGPDRRQPSGEREHSESSPGGSGS